MKGEAPKIYADTVWSKKRPVFASSFSAVAPWSANQQVPQFKHTETALKESTYIGFYGHFVPSQIIPFYSQIVAHFRWKARYKTRLFLASLLKEKGVLMSNVLVSARSLTHSPLSRRDRPCRSTSFLPLVTSSVLIVKDNFVRWLVQSEEIFQTIPEWAQSSQGHQRKTGKNHVNLTWKFPWKSCFTTNLPFFSFNPKILKAFLKPFPTKLKPTKRPEREKNEARKAKKQGRRRKPKVKGKTTVSLLILLSAHAWTSQANILHQDQKAAKCSTCKRLCGKF